MSALLFPVGERMTLEGSASSCQKVLRELVIEVPLVPPSVNHYVKHTRRGFHYITKEGKAFLSAVGICARGRSVVQGPEREWRKQRYGLEALVYLGHDQRGDGDNFWKVIADGLVKAGVIHSDSAVSDWVMRKRRDRKNPRTEIRVVVFA